MSTQVSRIKESVKSRAWLSSTSIRMFLALMIMSFLVGLFQPRFASISNLKNVLRQASLLANLAFAEAFVVLVGGLDISVGSNVALVTICCALTTLKYGVLVGILAGTATGGLVGLMNGSIIAFADLPPFIVTLGTYTAVHGVAFLITNGQPVYGLPKGFEYLGGASIGPFPVPIIVAAVVFALSFVLLNLTRFGRHLYAVGGNTEAARLSGVNVKWVIMRAYILCGLLTGIGGVVFASRVHSGQPNLGIGMELDAIAAVVLGGIAIGGGYGSITGVIFGVLITSVLRNALNLLDISSYVQMVVIGAVIILAASIDRLQSKRG